MSNKKIEQKQVQYCKEYIKIEKPEGKLATLKAIVLLCYNINKLKNFENIKYAPIKDLTIWDRVKSNLFYLDYIDHESQLFNSIISTAKKTLEEELQPKKYEYWYYYFLDYFCEIDLKSLISKKSKNIVYYPEKFLQKESQEAIKEEPQFISVTIAIGKNEVIINPRWTGKRFLKEKKAFNDFKENLNLD